MRILSILAHSRPSPNYGGAERQMHALHKGLQNLGLEIHVLADLRAVAVRNQEFDGLPIWGATFPTITAHPFRPGNIKFWRDWRELCRLVSSTIPRPDLIQVATFREPALIGYWLAQRLGVPWVVRLACSGTYGDFAYSMKNWLSRWQMQGMTQSVTRVVALDQQTRDEALGYGVPHDRVVIIPNALVFQRPPIECGKRYTERPLKILYLGRLAQQKRLTTLLAAMSSLGQHSIRIEGLRLVGGGDQREALEAHATQLGIADLCHFIGMVEWPEDELSQADCFINPSESEGLPNAVLEAAAFGLPLILSDLPVHREIAAAVGMTDYLFPVGDAVALAAAIARFIALEAMEKAQLSRQCAAFGQRFAPEIRDQAYFDLYRQIVGEGVV